MEGEQIKQQLDWLEEKRKQDGLTLETMQTTIRGLDDEIKGIERKISGIPTEIARLSENISRINQLDDALVKQREDISRQLNEFTEKRQKREKQKENIEKKTRDNILKDFSALQTEFSQLNKSLEHIKAREHEEKRIASALEEIKKQIAEMKNDVEKSTHGVAVIEESRKHDIRRMGDLTSDISSIRDKQEKYLAAHESMETRARRLEEQLNKLLGVEGERRDELDFWMQQQQSRLLDYERSWKEWVKRFEAFDERANQIDERIQTYQGTYLSMKQVGQDMTSLMDKLERRITEIAEMQRLSEDKLRKELNVFLAEDQKRWNTFKLTYEERWREHARIHEKMDTMLEELNTTVHSVEQSYVQIDRFSKKQMLDLLSIVRDWATERDNS